MKTSPRPLLCLGGILLGLTPAAQAEETCSCCAPKTAVPAAAAQPEGHPLRGVIVDVLADKQALLVKHEEIPGVMHAMTMLLKTDAATLGSAKKGQTITATLTKRADGWWITGIRPATATP